MHECIQCDDFGREREECGKCGSGSGSFYIGRKLSKMEAMNLEEEEEVNRTFEHRKEHLYRKAVVVDK